MERMERDSFLTHSARVTFVCDGYEIVEWEIGDGKLSKKKKEKQKYV